MTFRQHNGIIATITTQFGNRSAEITASGNGRLNAVSNALKKAYGLEYDLDTYEEHALEKSSSSRAIAYVGVRSRKSGVLYWGAGVDVDIIRASVSALLTAVNNMVNAEDKHGECGGYSAFRIITECLPDNSCLRCGQLFFSSRAASQLPGR